MSACTQCGGTVIWKLENGRYQCYQPDGVTVHWDHCSKRRWEQTVATGQRFENETDRIRGVLVSGYARSIHGTQYDRIEAKPIRGKHYKPDGCTCGLPPWDLCNPNCEHAI